MEHGCFIYGCDDLRLVQIVSRARIYHRGIYTVPLGFRELAMVTSELSR